jgi:hypothetical protein
MRLNHEFRKFMLLVGGLVAAAAASAAVDNQAVLARIGAAETITAQDLSDYLDRRMDLRPARRNAYGVETILREMALTRTLGFEGDAMGVPRRADADGMRFDDVYAHAMYKKLAQACEPPADAAAARKYFEDHPQAFRVPPMARLSRIMLPATSTVDGEPALGWLFQQAQAIASGAAKLEDVADKAASVHKLDPQGDLGWVTLTDDAKILRALADAKQGELVGPVREGDFGYLFYIAAKRESRQLAWDEVATSVPKRAVTLCRQEANEKLRDTLFKKYSVEIDPKAIEQLFSEEARTAPQAEGVK